MTTIKASQTLKAFKVAYKVVRDRSKEIYKGFGLRHLSDVTQYYVHPDNESFKGTTTLCQPIGEAVILLAQMLQEIAAGHVIGDYAVNDSRDIVYLEIQIPEDYHANHVVPAEVSCYRAIAKGNRVSIAAYDQYGRWIDGDMSHLRPLYKLLPFFMVLLARTLESEADYRRVMEHFIEKPAADVFVNLHEDFYQMSRFQESLHPCLRSACKTG